MKRQRGRGRKPGNNQNRTFESNGPDVKIRGNAAHIYDKYMQLARDATSSGDRVMAENYYQHAEHYLRLVQANQPKREENTQDQQADANAGEDADANSANAGGNDDANADNRNSEDGGDEREGNRNRNRRGRRRRDDGPASDQGSNTAPGSDPLAVVNPEEGGETASASSEDGDDQPAPRRSRRPRRRPVDNEAESALQAAEDSGEAKSQSDDAAA